MLILGLDFETSSQDPTTTSVVEVGAVMWETGLRAPVRVMDYIVYDPDAVWEEEASAKNGLNQDICKAYGKESLSILKLLIAWYQQADVACAHNGNIFDRPVFEHWCDKFGLGEFKDENKVWIDTKTDLDVPEKWSKRLSYLATHYGLLNPFPHRGFSDVLTMLMILDQHDLNKVMELAKSPSIVVQAMVPFERKDEAKIRGYYWRPEKKQWIKSIKAAHFEREKEQMPFPVRILPN